jgi:hypothetical protein
MQPVEKDIAEAGRAHAPLHARDIEPIATM